MTEPKSYKADEIFKPIPDDPEHVLMQIPPDICEKMGWTEGTEVKVTVEDGSIIISKV